ncbi:MAG TPA: hypothetical protein VNV88_05465 [Candidatus Solibacter sp.]|jgi:hypothetical protein|nr:hypothetical protein [Candidatus Solibacter sp.]
MISAATLRTQVEHRLRDRCPAAFGQQARPEMPVIPTGIPAIDARIGGIPSGAITEICGNPLCSTGSTSLLTALLQRASENHFCAWIDATDALNPRWIHGAGVGLNRVLWVRCQEHPAGKYRLNRLEQALKAADLLLKANCGFSLVIVDLEDIPEKLVRYVPLDVWYRFRLTAEKLSTALVFSTPFPVTGTSSSLRLRLHSAGAAWSPASQDACSHARILHAFNSEAEIIRSRDLQKRDLKKDDLKKNAQSALIAFSSAARRWY